MVRLRAVVLASAFAGALATACSFILDVEPAPPAPPSEDAAADDAAADGSDAADADDAGNDDADS